VTAARVAGVESASPDARFSSVVLLARQVAKSQLPGRWPLSNAAGIVPPVSIVIRWPENIAADAPKQLARRLAADKTAATWAVEEPRQLAALGSAVGNPALIDAALMVREASSAALGESLANILAKFEAASVSLGAIAISGALRRGEIERTLCQAGIRAVIGGAVKAKATGIRSLPFGILEFRPHIETRAARRWLPLGGILRRFDASKLTSAAVIGMDFSRMESSGSRLWHAIEQVVDRVAEAAHNGAVRVITISQLTAELSRQSVSRPQRSILRMAA
jgi:hypothetical protein